MCLPKAPKPPPMPKMPSVYTTGTGTEVVDQASQDANLRERRRRATMFGRQSTMLAGSTGAPPTAGAKTLLGN